MNQARAAITDGEGNFSIGEIEVDPPRGDEVLVEIKASGICHTDHDSMRWGRQLIMGHEGAGVVRAVGDEVRGILPGDRVVLSWAIPCGACFQCHLGNESLCEINSPVTGKDPMCGHARADSSQHRGMAVPRSFNLGTMSSLALVREPAVVKLPEEIPFSSACLLGCAVMTGVGSVTNAAKLEAGSSAVVLGAGGVGLNVIQGARIAAAAMIVAIDISEDRLATAKKFGATHTICASREDRGLLRAAEEVRALTGGRGADYAFECTAVPQLGAAPLAMVRNGGTAIQVSGIEQEIPFDMELFEWDKTYLNPLYGKCRPAEDFPMLISYYRSGALMLDELVTRTYQLDDLAQAFDDLVAGRNAKGVILF
ncbi:MAG: S-(hydroxymethyl)glutathione dehydrogenase/alcohol dehydrogenase [Verrucomicrobiales bacterium]|jgi:S-(hydroxymethyl)glutathione dehydrogenase/alcohol dehydrogenase